GQSVDSLSPGQAYGSILFTPCAAYSYCVGLITPAILAAPAVCNIPRQFGGGSCGAQHPCAALISCQSHLCRAANSSRLRCFRPRRRFGLPSRGTGKGGVPSVPLPASRLTFSPVSAMRCTSIRGQ